MTVTPVNAQSFIVDNQWASTPEHIKIDNCHELVQSKDGRIFLSADHPGNNVIIFSSNGDFLDSWTLGYDGCHGLTLFEQDGIEYLLITQTGVTEIDGIVKKGLGEVVKTDLNGNVLHKFANPFELEIYSDEVTYNPTETCVAPNGDIYIADGYGASYIHSFNQQGVYQFSFGGSALAPDDASLINPHGIAIDPRLTDLNGDPLLVVSSRKQSKFKHFTLAGEFVSATHVPGAYPCRAVISGDYLYSGVCWSGPIVSNDDLTNYANRLNESGFIIVIDKKGTVIEAIGANKPEYVDHSLQPLVALSNSPFAHIHDVLPLNDGSMLVSQWRGHQTLPYRVQIKNP